ncbi:RNA polymerase sigma-70 factor, ECF subfamily [Dyadobacter koreensis]|uniref:RNA polymerase sigma-70 factor, ECF subfamily n=1 Tax=Dyadobacter koreensis TaxID=408657 RepID=A0A1H6SDY2_9BACT|nr:RNA polymerase sigma-70 factor [Dyadobacter koreensis]SEI61612.1 RNA polymerase sigma-70 factor, ECF subfamily [Dyadobacter koreensis]
MITRQNDLFLISLIKKGDKRALDCLFKKYYNSLCKFAYYLTSRNDLSEEIVADVFLRIWEKREKISVEKNLKSYLFMATRHTAINYMKQEKLIMEDLSDDIVEENPGPEDVFLYQELESRLTNLINFLPQKRKAIFQLNRFEGFTYNEIAEILSLSSKTVENQMGKAIKQLKLLQKTYQI